MKPLFIFFFLLALSCSALAQVGINTTDPKASLDIQSSNQATPSNNDGILIPKIDEFPTTNPTADQDGIMVFATGNGTPTKGFYFWDQTATTWVHFSTGTISTEWTDHGVYISPTDGNGKDVTIGGNDNGFSRLTVRSDKQAAALLTNTTPKNGVMLGLNTYLENTATDPGSSTAGVYNDVLAHGQGYLLGMWNQIRGNGSGKHLGVENNISGAGTGEQVGVESSIINTGDGIHIGVNNILSGSGTGNHFGIENHLGGTGTGEQTGVFNEIDNSGNAIHTGTKTILSGTGTGNHFGSDVILEGTGSGDQVGTRNILTNTGSGQLIGTENFLSGNGNGIQRGTRNTINNDGNNRHIGTENILGGAGTGTHYGTSNELFGSGTGSKFASYQYIDPSAGGNQYGVYSSVLKPSGYAGYFLGKVAIGTTTANIYSLPDSRAATNGDFMVSDANGNLSWAGNIFDYWKIGGNYADASNFLGTTNSEPLRLGAWGAVSLRVTSSGIIFNDPSRNISIGADLAAGYGGGTDNIFMGRGAGWDINTGSYNVAIGTSAATKITTGENNTAVGYNSMEGNTTGERNTAIGRGALLDNKTGSDNVSIGQASLFNIIGSRNVAVGKSALAALQQGNGNIAIGYGSGHNANFTSGVVTNTILIGNEVFIPGGNSGPWDYKLNIGNLVFGNGLDGTEYTVSSGNIGIGIPEPVEKLEVEGNIAFSNNTNDAAILKVSNRYSHVYDNNLSLGPQIDAWTLASQEGGYETAGIHGNQDFVMLWCPGDQGRYLRIIDEDNWNDNDSDPYNNGAEVAYIGSGGQYFQVSDQNRKEQIKNINAPMEKLKQLNGYTYKYKNTDGKQNVNKTTSGVLAQELYRVFPEAVEINEHGEYFVHYAGIVPLLIEGIKAQQQEIDELKTQRKEIDGLKAMKREIDALKKEMKAMRLYADRSR
ncbi:tail fiber domain-containing protein [Aequorivita marina]|uniref:tail fiber domain-containing protein n=1 Tax=Aequorivita marina TaxID=3073654 RepID=UPI0028770C64|nr:tail fiber domain-containing protein [Aequorivita sp. S2608]MDS1298437.1 tail fiber domain-containing protein [Aequorivita sp. S2608]